MTTLPIDTAAETAKIVAAATECVQLPALKQHIQDRDPAALGHVHEILSKATQDRVTPSDLRYLARFVEIAHKAVHGTDLAAAWRGSSAVGPVQLATQISDALDRQDKSYVDQYGRPDEFMRQQARMERNNGSIGPNPSSHTVGSRG